jgi:hypothetical protein
MFSFFFFLVRVVKNVRPLSLCIWVKNRREKKNKEKRTTMSLLLSIRSSIG